MIEVLRTNDPVRISYAMVLLTDAGCHPFTADRFMSSAEGTISAVQRRIMVPDAYGDLAKETLKQLDTTDPLSEDVDYGDGGEGGGDAP
jgi:hypothetical protein